MVLDIQTLLTFVLRGLSKTDVLLVEHLTVDVVLSRVALGVVVPPHVCNNEISK